MAKWNLDKSWSLFLDRDGVINHRLPGDYVSRWEDFIFHDGALEALKIFANNFGVIVMVTNQQGIGKGLMTMEQVHAIHAKMLSAIRDAGGRIDKIYLCPDLSSKKHHCRKPAPAMALAAKADFPQIDFNLSVMVGDSISDMEFGAALGMRTVLIESKKEDLELLNAMPHPVRIDARYSDLLAMRGDLLF